jgi:putative polyketide hydroxylase
LKLHTDIGIGSKHFRAWVGAGSSVRKMLKGVRLRAYDVYGDRGLREFEQGNFERAAGISNTGAILVRPDGVIAWRTRRMSGNLTKQLEEAMVKILCL